METNLVEIEKEEDCQVIIGQAQFIKTAEDLYEAMVGVVPGIKFGIGFNEASGPCLTRGEGNDEALEEAAKMNAFRIGAGHSFIILFKNAFPINVLNTIKNVNEVARIFCATGNNVQVIVATTNLGKAILGVVDGINVKAIESHEHKQERRKYVRSLGYKLQ
ncbi:MAG: adenosine-specific kinase [Candidatus Marsarchaeota archaeon]|nr:adenosine-specific kinase [Candidatus Marsarchaeota archaeon]MCL5105814.1 adenosine-specific kinase [Candidatus Marsarchaeota archaeon]